jgi:hypothetical protein
MFQHSDSMFELDTPDTEASFATEAGVAVAAPRPNLEPDEPDLAEDEGDEEDGFEIAFGPAAMARQEDEEEEEGEEDEELGELEEEEELDEEEDEEEEELADDDDDDLDDLDDEEEEV